MCNGARDAERERERERLCLSSPVIVPAKAMRTSTNRPASIARRTFIDPATIHRHKTLVREVREIRGRAEEFTAVPRGCRARHPRGVRAPEFPLILGTCDDPRYAALITRSTATSRALTSLLSHPPEAAYRMSEEKAREGWPAPAIRTSFLSSSTSSSSSASRALSSAWPWTSSSRGDYPCLVVYRRLHWRARSQGNPSRAHCAPCTLARARSRNPPARSCAAGRRRRPLPEERTPPSNTEKGARRRRRRRRRRCLRDAMRVAAPRKPTRSKQLCRRGGRTTTDG